LIESGPVNIQGNTQVRDEDILQYLNPNLDPELLAQQQQEFEQAELATIQGPHAPSTHYDTLHQEVYNEFYHTDDELHQARLNRPITRNLSTTNATPEGLTPASARSGTRFRRKSTRGSTRPPRITLTKPRKPRSKKRKSDDQRDDQDDDEVEDGSRQKKPQRMKPVKARILRVEKGRRRHGPDYVMPSWIEGLSSHQLLIRSYVHDHLPGIPVFSTWDSRGEVYECCVHRDNSRTVAGGAKDGATSVLLGSYNSEGVDRAESFTMNGEGGRAAINPTAVRNAFNIASKVSFAQDQRWARGNLALKKNIEERLVLRVVRSAEGTSPYRPIRGFRYDGLYYVTGAEELRSSNGCMFILFSFERLPGQPPIPRHPDEPAEDDEGGVIEEVDEGEEGEEDGN
jgi:hypothetical protein